MKDDEEDTDERLSETAVLDECGSLRGQLIAQVTEQTFDDNVTDHYIGARGEMNRAIRLYKRRLAERLWEFYTKESENNGENVNPIEIDKKIFTDLECHPINERHRKTIKDRETISQIYADPSRGKCAPQDIKEEVFRSELIDIEQLTNDVIAMIPNEDLPLTPPPTISNIIHSKVKEELALAVYGDSDGRENGSI